MLTDESLLVKHNTRLSCHLGDTTVLLNGIDCTGLDADEVGNFMPGIDVAFQFTNSEGAFPIHSLLKLSLMSHSSRNKIPNKTQRNAHGTSHHEPTIPSSR
jgi:hypothetical protein